MHWGNPPTSAALLFQNGPLDARVKIKADAAVRKPLHSGLQIDQNVMWKRINLRFKLAQSRAKDR